MDANRLPASNRARLLVAVAYATVVCVSAIWVIPRTAASIPLLMIALGLPLIFKLVPRNYIYGMRSVRSLWTTEENWYRQNVVTGVMMVGVGTIWLLTLAFRSAL